MTYVRVTIDLDEVIDELDTDDLVSALEKKSGRSAPDPTTGLHELFVALKLGQSERALEIARRHVSDQLGVCL
jgi:hypothetical protein